MSLDPAPEINELSSGQRPESASPQTPASTSQTEKRPRLRLRSLDDTLRAHARLLRASFGKVAPDVYSRMLTRHSKMLSERYLQAMHEKLAARNALLQRPRPNQLEPIELRATNTQSEVLE